MKPGTGLPLRRINGEGYMEIAEVKFGRLVLSVGIGRYPNGRIAIPLTLVRGPKEAMAEGPSYGKFSVNIVEAELEPGEFVISHDAEAELVACLVGRSSESRFEEPDEAFRRGKEPHGTPLFEDTGKRIDYGHVMARPVVQLCNLGILDQLGMPPGMVR